MVTNSILPRVIDEFPCALNQHVPRFPFPGMLARSKPCFTHLSYLTYPSDPQGPAGRSLLCTRPVYYGIRGRLFLVCFAALPTSISGVRPVGLDRYAPTEARVNMCIDPYIRPSEPFGLPPGRSKTISGGLPLTGGIPMTTAPRVVSDHVSCLAKSGTPTYAPRVG